MLTKSWRMFRICGRIQNLEWTQLESTFKNIRFGIENASFGYELPTGNLMKRRTIATGGPSDSETMSPGGDCFAPLVPWKRMLRTIISCIKHLFIDCFVDLFCEFSQW